MRACASCAWQVIAELNELNRYEDEMHGTAASPLPRHLPLLHPRPHSVVSCAGGRARPTPFLLLCCRDYRRRRRRRDAQRSGVAHQHAACTWMPCRRVCARAPACFPVCLGVHASARACADNSIGKVFWRMRRYAWSHFSVSRALSTRTHARTHARIRAHKCNHTHARAHIRACHHARARTHARERAHARTRIYGRICAPVRRC
jgi:hypothetical protein